MRQLIGTFLVLAFALGLTLPALGQPAESQPARVISTIAGEVVIDAVRRTVSLNDHTLEQASGVADAAVLEGLLLVAQRDGVVLVYGPVSQDGDAPPPLVQKIEGLGNDLRAIVVSKDAQRAMVLSAGTTEIFGIVAYSAQVREENELTDHAFVDHARFMEFVRDEQGQADEVRAMDVGAQVLGLATDKELLELFYPDRSYRVLSRTPLPEGLARVEALAYTGSRWVLVGFDSRAEAVAMTARSIAGPWQDIGVAVLDRALADGGEPIAWLPGGFDVTDGKIHLAIRGERAAIVSWPASSDSLDNATVDVRWLEGR